MKYALTAIMLIFVAITSMAGVHLDFGLETRYSTIPDDPADTRISSGSAIWQTYGYYGIYNSGCAAVGMTTAGFASGFIIGGIFGEILGGKSYAEKEYRRGKIILWSGTAAAYGLALLGPKIVAHNLRQDDPNAPYDEILQSGLITEAACNAVGIGFLALGWSIEEGFLANALVIAGFLCFFVPTPTVM
ncbi:MAG TPA: hypothetical protein ENN75_03200, partial [candidate division Zixibacteria bacterium]|nr:hypothetical protein [candidate division Zixibacteria bacterium]